MASKNEEGDLDEAYGLLYRWLIGICSYVVYMPLLDDIVLADIQCSLEPLLQQ
jgi:hypothetical protein